MTDHSTRKVVAVIPTHNGARFIANTLRSLREQSRRPDSIIVVDDASGDNTVEIVRAAFPEVTVVERETNGGFGAASNDGFRYAIAGGAESIFLLNQDVVVEPDALNGLAHEMYIDSRYGILSSLNLTYDGKSIDPCFRNVYLPGEYWDDVVLRNPRDVYEVGFTPAAAILLRTKALVEVGGFDPLFFMYGEDEDLCYRMRHNQWAVGIVPRSQVRHWHSLVNHEKTFRTLCNVEYSKSVLGLKKWPNARPGIYGRVRGTVGAYRRLLRPRLRPRSGALMRFGARVLAVLRCLLKAPKVHGHRQSNPVMFVEHVGRVNDQNAEGSLGTEVQCQKRECGRLC